MDEMLSRMSSMELSEWMAYERHAGPLGTSWQDETASQIHELLQFNNFLLSQANFASKQKKKGPAPPPEHHKRPSELGGQIVPDDLPDYEDEWVTPDDMDIQSGDDITE